MDFAFFAGAVNGHVPYKLDAIFADASSSLTSRARTRCAAHASKYTKSILSALNPAPEAEASRRVISVCSLSYFLVPVSCHVRSRAPGDDIRLLQNAACKAYYAPDRPASASTAPGALPRPDGETAQAETW